MADGVNIKGGHSLDIPEENLNEILNTLHAHTAEEPHAHHQPQFSEEEINAALQNLHSHTDPAVPSREEQMQRLNLNETQMQDLERRQQDWERARDSGEPIQRQSPMMQAEMRAGVWGLPLNAPTQQTQEPPAHNRSEGMQEFINSVLSDPDVKPVAKEAPNNNISVITFEGGASGFRVQNQTQDGEVLGVTNNLTQQQLQDKIPALTPSQINDMKQNDTQMVSTGASVVTIDQYRQQSLATPEATMKGGKADLSGVNPALNVPTGSVLEISAGESGYNVTVRPSALDDPQFSHESVSVSAEDLGKIGFSKDDLNKLEDGNVMIFDGQKPQTMVDYIQNMPQQITPKNYQSGINGTAFTTHVASIDQPLEFDIKQSNQLSAGIFQNAATPDPATVKLIDAKIGIIAPEFAEASNSPLFRNTSKLG